MPKIFNVIIDLLNNKEEAKDITRKEIRILRKKLSELKNELYPRKKRVKKEKPSKEEPKEKEEEEIEEGEGSEE